MSETERYDPELERIVAYFHNVWESAILVAALELDLFGLLHDGPRSADELAKTANIDAKGVRILLDALCPAGLIEKRDGKYALTSTSARYLDPKSESYPGPIHWGAARPERWAALGRLADSVRAGKPAIERSGDRQQNFRGLVKAIAHSSFHAAPLLADHFLQNGKTAPGWSMLDAACGSGAYGLKLLQKIPDSRLTLLDLPQVLELAQENADDLGLAERIDTLPGDLLEMSLPEEAFDLILLSHFLHMISREDCAAMIAKLARAQKPGGYLAVHEFVPDENRSSRRFPLLFAMNMYIANGVGDTYTFNEIKAWMEAAGYAEIEMLDTPGRSSFVIGRKK